LLLKAYVQAKLCRENSAIPFLTCNHLSCANPSLLLLLRPREGLPRFSILLLLGAIFLQPFIDSSCLGDTRNIFFNIVLIYLNNKLAIVSKTAPNSGSRNPPLRFRTCRFAADRLNCPHLSANARSAVLYLRNFCRLTTGSSMFPCNTLRAISLIAFNNTLLQLLIIAFLNFGLAFLNT
jgi:hypothetical protein